MQPFLLNRANDIPATVKLGRSAGAAYIAGGTDLLQLMKDDVRRPRSLVDLEGLKLDTISADETGLHLGAMARMSEVADDPSVARDYSVIAEALLASAAPQIRNLGTMAGNLLQRTRCTYYRDVAAPCNKREPGTGCSAIDGVNRGHAIFGGSSDCIATHASDLAVALVALDAVVHLSGVNGTRDVKLTDFYLIPDNHPDIETILSPGDLIVGLTVPAGAWTKRSHYLKVRDRASFEFALTSAAVALEIESGIVKSARVAVGGVGTKPWRLPAVEEAIVGASATSATWAHAADLAIMGAAPLSDNRFKVRLLRNTVERALDHLGNQA